MDRAYDRTNPVCTRRTRPDVPPTVAAIVLTRPSTPRLSKYTDSLVSHWPGRISSDSLTVLPYSSLRAATVSGDPCGAVTGTGRRPYIAHARAIAAITSTSVPIPAAVHTAGASG